VRPSPSALFVVLAMATATGVGAFAKSAAGSADAPSSIRADAARYGFVPRATAANVTLYEATREFRLDLANGPVRAAPPPPHLLAAARSVVTRELERYPSSFLAAAHLRGVVLAEDLVEGDHAIPSLPNVGGLMLLDVDAAESDLVRTLHHEIYHFADLADDGRLAPDPAWEALNARSFVYGAGGRSLRTSWAASAGDVPGFVSGYATSGPEEDKAETFAFAVARPDAVRARLGSDPVLAAKLREVTRRVEDLDGDAPSRLGLRAF
jgi:hypothetical protein